MVDWAALFEAGLKRFEGEIKFIYRNPKHPIMNVAIGYKPERNKYYALWGFDGDYEGFAWEHITHPQEIIDNLS